MKDLYKTPEITVEELAKTDVLCASGDATEPATNGVYNIEGSARDWLLEDAL